MPDARMPIRFLGPRSPPATPPVPHVQAQTAPGPRPPPASLEVRKGWDPGSRDETRAHQRRVICEPRLGTLDRRRRQAYGARWGPSVHVPEDAPVVSDDALERLLELLLPLLLVELHEDLVIEAI